MVSWHVTDQTECENEGIQMYIHMGPSSTQFFHYRLDIEAVVASRQH
jgi:hypothetical protein